MPDGELAGPSNSQRLLRFERKQSVEVFVRHTRSCPHQGKGRNFSKCPCPRAQLQHLFLKEIGVSSISLAAPGGLLGKLMTHVGQLALPLFGKSLGLGGVRCRIGSSLRSQFAVTSGGLEISPGTGRRRYRDRAQRNSYLGAHILLFWLSFCRRTHWERCSSGQSASQHWYQARQESVRQGRTAKKLTTCKVSLRLLLQTYCSFLHTFAKNCVRGHHPF
jgi:hypothetical protein